MMKRTAKQPVEPHTREVRLAKLSSSVTAALPQRLCQSASTSTCITAEEPGTGDSAKWRRVNSEGPTENSRREEDGWTPNIGANKDEEN